MLGCCREFDGTTSLRSKRFGGVSAQISMFWPRENWGESKKRKRREGERRGENETFAVKPPEFENRPLVLSRLSALRR